MLSNIGLFPHKDEEDEENSSSTDLLVSPEMYYTRKMWKNVKEVFICKECNLSVSSEDDVILHVVEHYPDAKQEQLLDGLVKAKSLKKE